MAKISTYATVTPEAGDIVVGVQSGATKTFAVEDIAALSGTVLTPLDTTGWSWVNQGGAVLQQGSKMVRLALDSEASEQTRGLFTSAPGSTPYTITALTYPGILNTSGLCGVGIGFRESSTSKLGYILYTGNAGGAGPKMHVRKNTNETTNSASATSNAFLAPCVPGIWLQITDNGTNVIYKYSMNGEHYVTLLSETRGTHFTTAPNQVGIIIQNFGAGINISGSIASWEVS